MRAVLLFVLLICVATAAADEVLTRVIDTGAGHRTLSTQTGSDGQGDLETNCGGEPQYVACSC